MTPLDSMTQEQPDQAADDSAAPQGEGRPWDEAIRAHAEWLTSGGKAGRQADLQKADLRGAAFHEVMLRGADLREADLAGADLSGAELLNADLTGARLRKADLRGAALVGAKLAGADLRGAKLQDADLTGACLRGAILRGAELKGADLEGADLHEADLQDADLVGTLGLVGGQLGGSNVAGAKLPEAILKFEGLANVQEAAKNAQSVLFSVIGLCAYTWLTIASTKDAQLINSASTASAKLPILGVDIPLTRFYQMVPLLLLCLYCYFHLNLQRLWEELANLPAIFPDGNPLDRKSYPSLLNGLVRVHVDRLRKRRSGLAVWQARLALLLGWALVPLTLVLAWGRYLSAHDWWVTGLHVVLLSASIAMGVAFLNLAVETLRDQDRPPFRWRLALVDPRVHHVALAAGSAAVFGLLSLGGIEGINPHLVDAKVARGVIRREVGDPRTWVPRAFAAVGFDTFATLDNNEVSAKPANWSDATGDLHQVKGADLGGRNLRYADAYGAFLANAFLKGADLRNADLRDADLRGADLRETDLRGANLRGSKQDGADLRAADLRGANLHDAQLVGARFEGIDLRGADLSGADLRGADLTAARLDGANLHDVDLHGARLGGAKLAGADLRRANLFGADLHGADLASARLDGANLADADLSDITGRVAAASAPPVPVTKSVAAKLESP